MKDKTTLKQQIIERIHQRFPPGTPRPRYELTRREVAEYLHALRIFAGVRREELARLSGIDPDTIARLEDPDYAEGLNPAEAHLQDTLLEIFGGQREPQRLPYRLPQNADQARDHLLRLKSFKRHRFAQQLRANFLSPDGIDLYNEV